MLWIVDPFLPFTSLPYSLFCTSREGSACSVDWKTAAEHDDHGVVRPRPTKLEHSTIAQVFLSAATPRINASHRCVHESVASAPA